MPIGALSWLPDLERLFAIVFSLLKKGGHLVVYETHPIAGVFSNAHEAAFDPRDPWRPVYSYFRKEPLVEEAQLDYYGGTVYDGETSCEFFHTIADLLNAVLAAGLILREFREYPHDISNGFAHLAAAGFLPLSYLLVAEKA